MYEGERLSLYEGGQAGAGCSYEVRLPGDDAVLYCGEVAEAIVDMLVKIRREVCVYLMIEVY